MRCKVAWVNKKLTSPFMLDACARNGIPCLLVSCKCDHPPSTWQIDPRAIGDACSTTAIRESFQTTVNAPQTHKRCISIILRSLTVGEPCKFSYYPVSLSDRFYAFSLLSLTVHIIYTPSTCFIVRFRVPSRKYPPKAESFQVSSRR